MTFDDDQLDRVFAALSDRTRRAILAQLATGDSSVSELAAPYDMSLQAVSKHLGILAAAGLVTIEKEGRVKRCHFEPQNLVAASDWVAYYQKFWTDRLGALGEFLKKLED